jgi:hypothetical protein
MIVVIEQLFIFGSFLFDSFIMKKCYDWVIQSQFQTVQISILQFVGITLFFSLFFPAKESKKKMPDRIFERLGYASGIFISCWILHFFL